MIVLTLLIEFFIFLFPGAVLASLIKLLIFRDRENIFIRLWSFGAVGLLAGLLTAHGINNKYAGSKSSDGLEMIPLGLMCLGILIGTINTFLSGPTKPKRQN